GFQWPWSASRMVENLAIGAVAVAGPDTGAGRLPTRRTGGIPLGLPLPSRRETMPPSQPRMNSRSSVERILLRSQWIVTRFIVRQNRNMEQPKLPQSPRATLALDAALEVLGEHGVHGLSHARIDK